MPKVVRPTGASVAAAQALVRHVESGQPLSRADVETIKSLLAKPELERTVGTEAAAKLAAAVEAPLREVKGLVPKFTKLTKASMVAARLKADVGLLRNQLVGLPGLTRQQQASRLFEFVAAYATHFVHLAQQLPTESRQAAVAEFVAVSRQLGLEQMVDVSTGRTGDEVVRSFVNASQPREVEQQLNALAADAPSWVDRPPAHVPAMPQKSGGKAPAAEADASVQREAPRRGRLGPRMLWNVLHLFRGQEESELSEIEKRDAFNQLVIAAGLTLTLFAVLVVVLVLL
jgi:hypothetical protein